MRKLSFSAAAAIALLATQVRSQQVGPVIQLGGGNACIGGVGVCDGKVNVVPSVDELIDTAINSTPLAFAGDADRKNIHNIIKISSYVAAIAHDPVTGLVIVSVLEGNGTKHDVVVATHDAPATGKTWSFDAKCLVLQEGKKVTAIFDTNPPHLTKAEINLGDTIDLKAPFCDIYKQASVTSARVKFTGLTSTGDAPPAYTNFLVGDQL